MSAKLDIAAKAILLHPFVPARLELHLLIDRKFPSECSRAEKSPDPEGGCLYAINLNHNGFKGRNDRPVVVREKPAAAELFKIGINAVAYCIAGIPNDPKFGSPFRADQERLGTLSIQAFCEFRRKAL